MLTYAVNGSAVTISTSDTIVSGSIGFPLKLTFDSSWNGRYKILVVQFRNGKPPKKDKAVYGDDCEFITLDKALGGLNDSAIETSITDRIPFPGGKFRVGVYGTITDTSGNVTRATPTIWSPYLPIGEGSEPRGIAFKPAPKLIEQLYAVAQSVRDDADNGEFDGEDGHSPYLGTNDHWMVWNGTAFVDSGVYAGGQAPSIGSNDHWFIGGVDTGVTAVGPTGATGAKGDKGDTGEPGTTTWAGITDKPSAFNSKWDMVSDKPTTFAPSAHNHDGLYYRKDELDEELDLKSSISETGSRVSVTYDPTTYKFSVTLHDKYYNKISTSPEIDLPIELLQNTTDNSLLTTNKTIVGAINELYQMIANLQ